MQNNDLFDLMMMLSSRYLVSKYGKDFKPVVLQVGCMYLLECQEGSKRMEKAHCGQLWLKPSSKRQMVHTQLY